MNEIYNDNIIQKNNRKIVYADFNSKHFIKCIVINSLELCLKKKNKTFIYIYKSIQRIDSLDLFLCRKFRVEISHKGWISLN